jgi:hypothetical protein
MRRILIIACGLFAAFPAWAAEPSGCDKFNWPVDRERAILTSEPTKIDSGATITPTTTKALRIALRPSAEANLPTPPERSSKSSETFAGFVRLNAIPSPGVYAISLSSGAWVDAIQDGKNLKTIAFSGATDCSGIRKLIQFELRSEPLVLQVSGVQSDSILIAITPAP